MGVAKESIPCGPEVLFPYVFRTDSAHSQRSRAELMTSFLTALGI